MLPEFVPTAGSNASIKTKSGLYEDVKVLIISRDGQTAKVKYDNGAEAKIATKLLEPAINASVNDRFSYYERLTEIVLNKKLNALFVSGEGGIGKSHTVDSTIEDLYMVEDKHFIKVKGHCSPYALFQALEENSDKTFVFDDCDSVLKDTTSLNILKAVLDTYGRRVVKWLTTKGSATKQFQFTGSAIFLSNLDMDSISDAIRSRCVLVDLSMTPEEKISRMEHIAPTIKETNLSDAEKMLVLSVIDKYKYMMKNLNLRSFIKALVVYEQARSMEILRYSILNS
jgi:hypothetical protein